MRKNKRGNTPGICAGYDFVTMEARLKNMPALFEKAKAARTYQETEWKRYNDYYNFIHDAEKMLKEFCEERGIPWTPATCPDPWIMVESQIDPVIPTPEFRGRDTDQDSAKAKQRELAVKYIIENNSIERMNTANERRLLKLGDGFWKAYWDIDRRCGVSEGDITVRDVSPEEIFPDPGLRSGDIQEGQYLCYVYSVHKVAFWRTYKARLKELGMSADEVENSAYVPVSGLFDLTTAVDDKTDTVQVMEFWFKWPDDCEAVLPDGKKISVHGGEVGCSIQAGDVELKLIPRYWKKTWRQCSLFPFVHYWRIRDENSFWNKSELYPILALVDAEDLKLGSALLNDMMMSNDIILCEEGALADGSQLTNAPGETVYLKAGRMGSVQRLGGLVSMPSAITELNYLKEQIERTNRNYETNLGKETSRQTTATGLAMLREDSGAQADIKKSDRNAGFERLFELLDWLALEWFDDDRLLYLGVNEEKGRKNAEMVNFNSSTLAQTVPEVHDAMTGEVVREEYEYWPKVDVTVTAGDGVRQGKQATLQTLQALCAATVTPENWKLYKAMLELIDIPQKQEIVGEWERKFGSTVPPEVTQALEQDPSLLQTVMQFLQAQPEQPTAMI